MAGMSRGVRRCDACEHGDHSYFSLEHYEVRQIQQQILKLQVPFNSAFFNNYSQGRTRSATQALAKCPSVAEPPSRDDAPSSAPMQFAAMTTNPVYVTSAPALTRPCCTSPPPFQFPSLWLTTHSPIPPYNQTHPPCDPLPRPEIINHRTRTLASRARIASHSSSSTRRR